MVMAGQKHMVMVDGHCGVPDTEIQMKQMQVRWLVDCNPVDMVMPGEKHMVLAGEKIGK